MKKLILVIFVMFGLYGCETMEGLGKDIQKAGEALEKKSQE
ncbi:MAG: entericidin A/B family lipoprotein [Gammaproteobacteria bacterium]|nr:entericidin A/B family lipoprotein [Gammaproteobacteria bacterium]